MADDSQDQTAGSVSIKFVGDAIYTAIKQLKANQERLPPNARRAGDAVEDAIKRLEDTAKQTQGFCAPTWFFPAK